MDLCWSYDLIANCFSGKLSGWQYKQLWLWNLPLKIKCFSWLCVGNNISTWDNLIKWGWIGPNHYCLCKETLETVNHLFITFSFAQAVRTELTTIHMMVINWMDPSLLENLNLWTVKLHSLLFLPFFISGVFGIPAIDVFLMICAKGGNCLLLDFGSC